jgi:UDP-N-acetylmuramoyl-tripeptide--D-alanyl-D-alanine ligase
MFKDASDSALARIDAAFQKSNGVTTDTRELAPGKLFFALKGERFDGNTFALQSLDAGCLLAIVDDPIVAQKSSHCVFVDNVLTTLQSLAALHRSRWDFPVIGLTGSNGKTTTKELLHAVLKTRYTKTFATHGNLNNHIGVPLTLLAIPIDAEMAVIEMGANSQGEIAVLAEIAQPTHGVILNIGEAHLEGFGGPDGVIKGKRELFRYFENHPSDAKHVFVHAGHPILVEISETLNRTLYGTSSHPPFIQPSTETETELIWTDLDHCNQGPLLPKITGYHNQENIMTALAIGLFFGISKAQCSEAINRYAPNNNRSQWQQTQHNLVLLDAYNANPSSMSSTLKHFAQTLDASLPPAICILGDMGELGSFATEAHNRIIQLARELGLEIWTVGPLFQEAASKQDFPIQTFIDTDLASKALASISWKNRRILLKGSRSIALEKLLNNL